MSDLDFQEPFGPPEPPPAPPPQNPAGPPSPLAEAPASSPTAGEEGGEAVDTEFLRQNVIAVLQTVYDPEIPVNIYELGMIYEVKVEPSGDVAVRMTLTSPACPVAGSLPGEVETKIAGIPGVTRSRIELVWDPPWNPSMMSEVARLATGMF